MIEKNGNVILRMKNVSKTYSNNKIESLSSIDLDINKGEFVFLMGPSGSGKTTFLKLLYKMEEHEKGLIFFYGKDISKIKKGYLRRKLGIVFQDYQLLLNKTVIENVKYPLECVGIKPSVAEKKAMEALQKMNILDMKYKYPEELSGGQQQRVAIARAIVNNPDFLICDEPTGNLDNENAFSIMKHLKALNEVGTTIIMSTHNEDIVNRQRNKRIVTLNKGKVVSDFKDEGVFESYEEYRELESAKDLVLMLSDGGK